ncbi:hypothetical protein BG000_004620 [Podila horticola]|nr:hypothetical protein BG000_004620 [Podila horticola]
MGNDKGWQNTVRHNLSHMKCFRRIMAKEALLMGPLTTTTAKDEPMDPSTGVDNPKGKSKAIKKGKGGYWILVPEHLEETSTQIRPKKNSVDHTGTGSSSSSLPRGHGASSPPATGAPKRKSQDLGIPTHQQHRPPPIMDHRGSLASASSLWAQPRFSEAHRLPQPSAQPHSSVQHVPSRSQNQGMDVDKDVASMEIASMAIVDSPPDRSQSHPPGQAPTRSSPYAPHHPRLSHHQQQAISSEAGRQEESEKRPEATSSRMSESSSRGSEEDELEEDEDDDYEDEEEDEDDHDDEDEEDEDDRSTSSKDSRLGAGMSIHHLLN